MAMVEARSTMWQIGTRLVPDKETWEWKGRGYVPSLPGSNVYFEENCDRNTVLAVVKPMYLDCAYEEMDAYLSRTYEGKCCGHTFHYRLQRSYAFIEEIEHGLLAKAASLYRINRPLIFAPDARRAVDICIMDGLALEELSAMTPQVDGKPRIDADVLKSADWQVDLIGGILQANYRLILTNVQFSKKAQEFANDGEDEDGNRYFDVRGNLPNQTLIIPEIAAEKDVRKIVSGSNGCSFRVYVNGDIDLRKYHTLTFSEPNPDDWVNVMQEAPCLPRLRTEGDINRFCQRFSHPGRDFECKFDSIKQPGESAPGQNVVRRYERRDRYPDWGEEQALFQARRYRPICYLRFGGAGKYLGDWAEYVLSACEHEYPEFSWAGVANG